MQSIARIGLAPRRLRIKILTTRWMMTSIFFGATRADELILRCYTPQLSPVGLLRIVLLARVLITARRRGGGNTRLDLLWVLRTVNEKAIYSF
jgi:hypothetical protein